MKKLTRRGFVKKVAQSLSKVAMCALAMVLLYPTCAYAAARDEWPNTVTSWDGYQTWTLPVTEENSASERGYVYNTEPGDNTNWKPLSGDAGAGCHWYTARVPKNDFVYVSKWELAYKDHTCSHHSYGNNNTQHGVSWNIGSCAEAGRPAKGKSQPLSSGWIPTCAHCGKEIPYYFYTTDDKIKSVNKLIADSFYYSKCSVCGNLEQGIYVTHECKMKSVNRFYIHYDGNGATGGSMKDSMHYMSGAATVNYEGTNVTNNLSLSTNGFSKKGYTFAGWAASPSDAVFANNNVSTALGNKKPSDGQVITVYAKWVANDKFGTLTINPNGGAYYGSSNVLTTSGQKGQQMINPLTILA